MAEASKSAQDGRYQFLESYVVEPNPGVPPFRLAMEAQAQLMRQLAVRAKAGLSTERCLAAVTSGTKDRRLRALCRQMQADVGPGIPLSIMMGEHPGFDGVAVEIVAAGERAGDVTFGLTGAAEYLERLGRLKREMHAAVAKPLEALSLVLLAIFVAAVALSFLVKETLPETLVGNPGARPLDRLAVDVAGFIRLAWPFVGVAGALVFLVQTLLPYWPRARLALERIGLTLPLVSPALSATAQACLARTTTAVMQTGRLLGEAVTVAAAACPYTLACDPMAQAIAAIEAGQPYVDAFVACGFFRRREINAVQAAERRDDLATFMAALADDREREAHGRIALLKAVAHTTVVLLLGLTIVAVVLALYVPVFVRS